MTEETDETGVSGVSVQNDVSSNRFTAAVEGFDGVDAELVYRQVGRRRGCPASC